ncbi:starch-binding protein [Flavobacterium palustre]|uniref:Starch-binding protein n=1 Tax=Flavobacterium palustre TaxID=1476463 RepID=A0ABQ1HMD6_9FLAO|nr:RagB/SusD family nutrient uptake outer membrane protein [Flavobacterium palustre]GGA83264.1 starch-binding protein [Flavobacterium palustre]
MKTNYIMVILAILLLTSCDKDFLNPDSISTFDNKYIYSNVDDARKGVNAVYSYFQQDAFRSRLSNNMCGNTDIERQSGWQTTADRYQIWNLDALDSNGDLNIVWTYAYRAIRDANIAIEGIKASGNLESTDASVKTTFNQLLGECYVIRAYWYSMLAYYFGDVPYITQAPVAGQNFFVPKSPRNEILSQEIQNIIDIEEKMQWADQLPFGIEQINREYALGMIARLSLQRGGYYLTPQLTMARDSDYLDYYQIAKEYAGKLITLKDRPLPTDFRQIFMNQCKFLTPLNQEILWEVPFAKGSGDVAWNIGITVDGGATAKHDYGSGNNYMGIPVTYYLSFDSKDKRRDVTCALYKINTDFVPEFISNVNNIAQGKWSRHFLDTPPGKLSAKGTGINWPMMRYADVLLMYAEAENELNGPTVDAQNALKRVRQRAFDSTDWITKVDGYVAQVSTSKAAFFDAIVDERGWEFGGEMIRKYELIRWGIYSDKVKETVDGLKQLADDAFNGVGTGPDYIYWKLDDKGNFIVFNPDSKVTAAPDDTWKRQSFLLQLHSNTTTYQEWITKDYANYYLTGPKPGVARYIFPIPTTAIQNSQGTLKNDGYNFQ